MRRIRLITMGSALGIFAVASLVGGFSLRDGDPAIAMSLIILGSLLVLCAAIPFVALVIAERVQLPTLGAGQRQGIVTYLRVSRYVRGAVESAVGTALIVAGVVTFSESVGVLILLFGVVLGLLAAGNFWMARHIRLAPPTDADLPAEQTSDQ